MKKKLSNPTSTGGGGHRFEVQVQAAFVALMAVQGFVPCLPRWPISKVKLQGKCEGYDTDDMIVFAEEQPSGAKCKLLAQIKLTISVGENKKFFEVMQSAWDDFNNSALFTHGTDAIALVTGPLSKTDIADVRKILEWARHSADSNEFYMKVEKATISSQAKVKKLRAFEESIRRANGGQRPTKEEIFDFLCHFYLLGYDLDVKSGVMLSLIQSVLAQSAEEAAVVWLEICDEVASYNANMGTLTRDSIPKSLVAKLQKPRHAQIPESLVVEQGKTDWSSHKYASDLALANLIGSWNERIPGDRAVVEEIAGSGYSTFVAHVREILQAPDSPLELNNGKWHVLERGLLFETLGSRIYDDTLDRFKDAVVSVLRERDPRFDLPLEERHLGSIRGKELTHSEELREGLATGLALLGSRSDGLKNCSLHRPVYDAKGAVREILSSATPEVWGSLNRYLPNLAEASPSEFLDALEDALQESLCPFDILFGQEGSGGLGGTNYLTGVFWGLELLAWDSTFLVRSASILGRLAARDPGGNWANRPVNSLITIFLPWFPQTLAPVPKRVVALETLKDENPEVAKNVLVKLLPQQHQTSSGSYRPNWRQSVPEAGDQRISGAEYWEQIQSYLGMVLELLGGDAEQLADLVAVLDDLPQDQFEQVLGAMNATAEESEESRMSLWIALQKLVDRHRKFHKEDWALDEKALSKIDEVIGALAPTDLVRQNLQLFGYDVDLRAVDVNSSDWEAKLGEERSEIVSSVLAMGGFEDVLRLARAVQRPDAVGSALAELEEDEFDEQVLPCLLDGQEGSVRQFVSGFVWRRWYKGRWEWVDSHDRSGWTLVDVGQFLAFLPSQEETWQRASEWLGDDEVEYWKRVDTRPFDEHSDYGIAVSKLIEYGRPSAAVECLNFLRHLKRVIKSDLIIEALLAVGTSEDPKTNIDSHTVVSLIEHLQRDDSVDPDSLFRVEWMYLPFLDRIGTTGSPKSLEERLASDPSFFCELIRLCFRSRKSSKSVEEPDQRRAEIARRAWRLLFDWRIPPGTGPRGEFSGERLQEWVDAVRVECEESGHIEVAMTHLGQVLFYSPADPDGLWMHRAAATVLNGESNTEVRNGYSTAVYSSRGAHYVDPSGEPERQLAEENRQKAEQLENEGFHRIAATLRRIAEEYEREAESISSREMET